MQLNHPEKLSVRQLAEGLRRGKTCPVGLTEYFLERLERIGPAFNCLVNSAGKAALALAHQRKAELQAGRDRGPLHGIPFGCKDLLATNDGIPTTWGFAGRREVVENRQAVVLQRLEQAGAVLIGKLAMVELAGGMKTSQSLATFTGNGINPWHTGHWTGGSSSGSASAVAAALVPFALGSETMASILNPSAYCGISGLRPSLGRVPRTGAMSLSTTLDKIGPMGRTADDCGLILEAIAGADACDPVSITKSFTYHGTQSLHRRLKILVPEGVAESPQEAVRENFGQSLKILESLGDIQRRPLPELPYEQATYLIYYAESAAAFQELLADGGNEALTAPEARPFPHALTTLPARDYINALRLRRRMQMEMALLLRDFDIVVSPANMMVAPPLHRPFAETMGKTRRPALTTIGNLIGMPALSIPNGFGQGGLPTGLQIAGPPESENAILSVAGVLQSKTDWHLQFPIGD